MRISEPDVGMRGNQSRSSRHLGRSLSRLNFLILSVQEQVSAPTGNRYEPIPLHALIVLEGRT